MNRFVQSCSLPASFIHSERAFRVIGGTDAGLYFRLTDHLGSTSLIADSTGAEKSGSRVVYAPFGEVRSGAQSTLTDFGYTGQRHDDSTGGLMFYNARYYLPGLGRFISADTIVPEAGNPQQWNRYSYVSNNPVLKTDPTGHRECRETDFCGGPHYIPELHDAVKLAEGQVVARSPDYFTLAGSVGVPDKWVKNIPVVRDIVKYFSVGGSFTIDRYGNTYGGLGFGAGVPTKSSTGASLTAGWLDTHNIPTEKTLENYLNSSPVGSFVGAVGGLGWSTNARSLDELAETGHSAIEVGLTTPQVGINLSPGQTDGMIYDSHTNDPAWGYEVFLYHVRTFGVEPAPIPGRKPVSVYDNLESIRERRKTNISETVIMDYLRFADPAPPLEP